MLSPPDKAHDALLAGFLLRGFARIETSVLQPAGLFLDLSGEDIRRRLYFTQEIGGQELCLRPEHTIPVCLAYLASPKQNADYCYLGPVFRQKAGQPGEFLQAGFESIGYTDEAAADAGALDTALAMLRLLADRTYEVKIGDVGMLEAVFEALDLPGPVRRRLRRALAAGTPIDEVMRGDAPPAAREYAGLLDAIEGQDPAAARAFVEDVISIAGVVNVGGRSAGEIAERFLFRAARRAEQVSEHAFEVLREYLAIDDSPDRALDRVRAFASRVGLDLDAAIRRSDRRLRAMAERGIDFSFAKFSAGFTRSLDYYTGFIFEIRDLSRTDPGHVAAGGRYDQLLEHLGHSGPIPAIGCSFWLDRLGAASR